MRRRAARGSTSRRASSRSSRRSSTAIRTKTSRARLGVTEPTVKHHLTSIYDKVGVSTRLELALFALHHSILCAPYG